MDTAAGKVLLSQVFKGDNTMRDLVNVVAVNLNKRTDDIVLKHEESILTPSDMKLVKLFLGDTENMSRQELQDSQFDVELHV